MGQRTVRHVSSAASWENLKSCEKMDDDPFFIREQFWPSFDPTRLRVGLSIIGSNNVFLATDTLRCFEL